MPILDLFASSPGLWMLFCLLIGLIVGSFLNVVISRLPRMMEAQWRSECSTLLELDPPDDQALSLSRPGSCCPHCQAPIRAWQNIPLLSFIWQRGRCAQCRGPISWQYPIVELAAGLLALWSAAHFGYGFTSVAVMGLALALLCLAVIDLNTQLLPDSIVLPLLWFGLAFNLVGGLVPIADAVVGAMAGYLSLWLVFHGFLLLTGKEGMGHGDFKLFAALGAWLGWQLLVWVILAASLVGAVVGIGLQLSGRLGRDKPMPFGPFLAAAGWLTLLYGNAFSAWYLSRMG